MPINVGPKSSSQPSAQRSAISGRRNTPGTKPAKGPHDLGVESGDQGEITMRISGKPDVAAQAEHRRLRARNIAAAAAAKEVAAAPPPARVRMAAPPRAPLAVDRAAEAAAGSTAPVRAARHPVEPVGAPAPVADAESAGIPVRVLGLVVDGEPRPGIAGDALLHGHVFEPSGQDEHGQPLFQLRPEAAISALREVQVKLANDGPRAKIAIFAFCGDRMTATEIEMGIGIQASVTLTGAFEGHIELGYAPVRL